MVDRMVVDWPREEVMKELERQKANPDGYIEAKRKEVYEAMQNPTPFGSGIFCKFTGATEALKSPRARFIMTAQLMSYAFGNFDNPYAQYPLI